MRRQRRTKVVATLGPASGDRTVIGRLFEAGADVFRINMSHTTHDRMRELVATIRAVEAEHNRPIGILVDSARAEAAARHLQGRRGGDRQGPGFYARHRSGARRRQARAAAASGNLRRHQAGRCAADRRRQAASGGDRSDAGNASWRKSKSAAKCRTARASACRIPSSRWRRWRRRTSPILKPRSTPASTGSRCRSSSAPRISPKRRRSRAAAPR